MRCLLRDLVACVIQRFVVVSRTVSPYSELLLQCISVENHIPKPRSTRQLSPSLPMVTSDSSSERPPTNAPPLSKSFPRFGGSECCPGCHGPVSLMQYGVVSGPQNSRWHGNCLVCGGKGAKPPRPGCGKKLDSAAKTDREGRVWCRECMVSDLRRTCRSLSSHGCILASSTSRGMSIPSRLANSRTHAYLHRDWFRSLRSCGGRKTVWSSYREYFGSDVR